MSKYVDRVLEEVQFNFDRHLHDNEDKVDFLEELIYQLKYRLENLNNNLECGICDEGECDCEPETGPGY